MISVLKIVSETFCGVWNFENANALTSIINNSHEYKIIFHLTLKIPATIQNFEKIQNTMYVMYLKTIMKTNLKIKYTLHDHKKIIIIDGYFITL